jgi:hypothetical protein
VDPSYLKSLGRRQWRQETDKALSEHRLARAGRTDHQQVMPSRRCDLYGHPGQRLTAHVSEVRGSHQRFSPSTAFRFVPRHPPLQARHDTRQRWRRHGSQTGGRGCFGGAVGGYDQLRRRQGVGSRQDPRHASERSVEAELADEADVVGDSCRQLPVGDEQRYCDRQIEA